MNRDQMINHLSLLGWEPRKHVTDGAPPGIARLGAWFVFRGALGPLLRISYKEGAIPRPASWADIDDLLLRKLFDYIQEKYHETP